MRYTDMLMKTFHGHTRSASTRNRHAGCFGDRQTYHPTILALLFIFAIVACCRGATYYVSSTGNDTNDGSATHPWATIQKAANTMVAGDTVVVLSGDYDEHVNTTRSGSSESARITFQAQGGATARGFTINNSYISIIGFDLTGARPPNYIPNSTSAAIEVLSGADHVLIRSNTFFGGNSIVVTDAVFTANSLSSDTISSGTGGFIAAGFRPGLTVSVFKAARFETLHNNNRSAVIQSVSDNTITLQATNVLTSEGPVPAYLDASYSYGLAVHAGVDFAVVYGNTFSNLDCTASWLGGANNLYTSNTFAECNGWGAMYFYGSNNVFSHNLVFDSGPPVKGYSALSPNAFESWAAQPTSSILFKENFIQDWDGVFAFLRWAGSVPVMHDVTFLRNVFARCGFGFIYIPNVSFINNTFVEVATNKTDAYEAAPFVMSFADTSQYYSEGAIVENNSFVGCGYLAGVTNGWYQFSGVTNYLADYNFVAGAAPGFGAKIGFDEGHPDLNGGDPGFVDINDPLGPDGIPFTADDGLRLQAGSKLRGAGAGGVDIGAYISTIPKLSISVSTNGMVSITWPTWAVDYSLQRASSLAGPWTDIPTPSVVLGLTNVFSSSVTNSATFYRLESPGS